MSEMCDLFHGSPAPIRAITDDGVFGGVFASPDRDVALSHGDVVHVVTSPRELTDFELNYVLDGAWEVAVEICGGDEAVAECIMSASCPEPDDCETDDSEQSWERQRLRGVLATRLGYTSVEMRDEHGTTWLCLPGFSITADSSEGL